MLPPVAAPINEPLAEPLDEPVKPKKEPKPPKVKAPKPVKEPKQPKAEKAPKPAKEPKAPKAARERPIVPLPRVPGFMAAIVTGALSGGITVVLAWATARGCAAVRHVGTCGSFGLFALIAILAIDVLFATALLRGFRVVDPATTSLLGVGLVAVLALLFFLDNTQSAAMIYVIPLLMATTFTAAWWITSAIAARLDQ